MGVYLDRLSQPAVSSLELLARYTSALWSFAHQYGVKPRAGVPLPPGLIQHGESSKTPDNEQEVR